MLKNVFIASLLAIAGSYAYAQDDLRTVPLYNPSSGFSYTIKAPAECLRGVALNRADYGSHAEHLETYTVAMLACIARMNAEQLEILRELRFVYLPD